jgi:cytochrome c556
MKKLAFGFALSTALFATVALAASPQEDRQAAMKQVGGAIGALSKMAKGEMAFDAAAAAAAFTTMNTVAKGYAALFPVGSETGMDTEAKAEIWSKNADFLAAVAKFEADTAAAAAATYADAGAIGAALGAVGGNCKSCHEVFRAQK